MECDIKPARSRFIGWPRDHPKAVALLHDSLRVGVVLDARDIVLRAYESRAPDDASASGVARCQQVSPSLVTLACGRVCINRPAISDAPAGLVGELCPALDARGLQLLSIWQRAERGVVPPAAPNAHGGARSRFAAGQPGSYCVPTRGLPRPSAGPKIFNSWALMGLMCSSPSSRGCLCLCPVLMTATIPRPHGLGITACASSGHHAIRFLSRIRAPGLERFMSTGPPANGVNPGVVRSKAVARRRNLGLGGGDHAPSPWQAREIISISPVDDHA
jgi:hypothetical protein